MMPSLQRHALRRRSLWVASTVALCTFLTGVMLSALLVWSLHRQAVESATMRFERHASQVQAEIQSRFDRTLSGFRGLRGAMHAMDGPLPRQAFKAWASSRDLTAEFPGIRGLGFIQRVERPDVAAFLAAERADAAPDFELKTSGQAPDLYVIKLIEPLENNQAARGYDVGSEPLRRAAIERAIDTGVPTTTAPIVLVQDGQRRPGMLYYLPVYRPGQAVETAAQRREALLGVVYAPIIVDELVTGIGERFKGLLSFTVHGASGSGGAMLLAHHVPEALSEMGAPGAYRQQRVLNIGGQPYTLSMASTALFDQDQGASTPLWIGALGMGLSALLAAALWLLMTGRARAQALAESMTDDLRQAKGMAEQVAHESKVLIETLNRFSLVCITDAQGNITDVNDAFCQLSGYGSAELLGRNPRLLSSGVHDPLFWVAVWQSLLHGQPWVGPMCNRSKSGALYWVQSVIAPIRRRDGSVEKYICIAHDITATRRAQDELKAGAERYNLAIDGGSDGLWDWMDVHAHAMWWSPQFFRLLGYEPDETEANLVTFDAMLHPDDQQRAFDAIDAALHDQKLFDTEYRLKTKAGEYRWFRSRAKVYFDSMGNPTRMAGSIQDVHERKMAQAQIQEHSQQMQAIFSLTRDGFVSFDAQRRVSYVSPAMAHLTGLPCEEMLGYGEDDFARQLLAQAVEGQAVQDLASLRTLQGAQPGDGADRVLIEMKPPARRVLEWRLSEGQGASVSQVLHLRDVTHESEVDQMKSAFLSMAAHELRTPMASIYGFTELLLTRDLKPEKQRELLGRIYRQSEAMASIINELLDLARIEARQGKDFSFEACNLVAVVADTVRDFKPPQEREAPVIEWPEQLHQVWVDRQKFQQALLNVLSNAYKYSPEGGDVHVRLLTRVVQGKVMVGVEVVDQGIGLSAEQLARVGERFYRADKSGAIPGTGLGVTIVKEILELMGGSLGLSSVVGKGTSVTLWLPRWSGHDTPRPDGGTDGASAPHSLAEAS